MEPHRFDRIAKMFANRRTSRRQALVQGGVGLALGALAATDRSSTSAQDATPEQAGARGPSMLFLQTYQSGSIAEKEGEPNRYTLNLEHGHGQTIYFSNRPDRIVGANPTPRFLEGLGFPVNNPPNAALVIESEHGETDVAVVELFSPVYDPINQGVTYEIAVLANWQSELEMDFTEAPTDLAALAPSFGAASLFIDDCPESEILCWHGRSFMGAIDSDEHDGFCYSWAHAACIPCQPWIDDWVALSNYWTKRCNQKYPKCDGLCTSQHLCSVAWNCWA